MVVSKQLHAIGVGSVAEGTERPREPPDTGFLRWQEEMRR
jgi:hypothetical protein